ncbi:hypothetical protein COB52_03165 [Candidatus Kaiserbacteria bacterium]|nr:MAG: hypothetical protein COB52_03165 [Candidatus Kaiserbacteria bacterium]
MLEKIQEMDTSPSTLKELGKNFATILNKKEIYMAMKLHKLRYQCKFHLQLCAVMSQLNKHIEALEHGKKSTKLCQELIK